MRRSAFHVGEPVVFRRTQHASTPAPNALRVDPSRRGDTYSYVVENYGIVVAVHTDGMVELVTKAGRHLTVRGDDLNLRKATLWERLRHHDRFPWLQDARPA